MIAAIRSNAGASRRLLRTVLERQRGITLLVSVPLLIEYESVMTRTEHLKAARLTVADIGVLLDAIAAVAEPVRLAFLWRPVLADADDDMVLEAAVNGRADAIITFNRRDFSAAAEQFGIPVLLPGEAVRRWEKRS
jgi:predicted nucleic acid-binding protein